MFTWWICKFAHLQWEIQEKSFFLKESSREIRICSSSRTCYWETIVGYHSGEAFLVVGRFANISEGILAHLSLQKLFYCLRVLGCCLASRWFSCLHRFSTAVRSGDWLLHDQKVFLLNHAFIVIMFLVHSLPVVFVWLWS